MGVGQLPDPHSDAGGVREQAVGTPETQKVGKWEFMDRAAPVPLACGRQSLRNFCDELCVL